MSWGILFRKIIYSLLVLSFPIALCTPHSYWGGHLDGRVENVKVYMVGFKSTNHKKIPIELWLESECIAGIRLYRRWRWIGGSGNCLTPFRDRGMDCPLVGSWRRWDYHFRHPRGSQISSTYWYWLAIPNRTPVRSMFGFKWWTVKFSQTGNDVKPITLY